MPYGYHGKILHIDLSNQRAWIETPDDKFWRIYGGGGLLATYYLLRESPPSIDAFDPANLLILASSVVAGQPYAGLARFTAAAKSPLTGGIGETRAEGPFGLALKGSGADAIVLHGRADAPVTLLVENGEVTFHAAGDLWGKTVGQTVDRLESHFGQAIHSAVIGPAGENQVRFASIVSDRTYQAARHGLGAVMGSKQVKAIVIRGEHLPPVADPATCAALTAQYAANMRSNALTRWQIEPPGFSAWVHLHGIDAALCVNNYQESVFAAADNYRAEQFMQHYQGEGNCPGCPNNCIKFFGPKTDSPYDPRAGGIHQEITGTLGPNCGIDDLNAIFQANVLCNDLGMDPTSLGFTLSMAMECQAKGLIDLPLRFGDARVMLETIREIAHRQGFGDLLAEGAKRAAAKIGGDAPRYALHVKGLEMVCFEPRTQTNLALGYAIAPIGPRYDICEHDWDFDTTVGWEHTLDSSRTIGVLQRIPMNYLGVDKVRNFKAMMTIWSAADALDFCIFAIAPTRVLTLEQMAQMLAAVTGWNTSSYEIMRYGERRLHLMRLYNLREGLSVADDTLPDRFFEDPIPSGQWAGTKLDRAQFATATRTYYRMMGWDDAGVPRFETLLDHHLEWVAG
jgi:aldehyde:ferredoxin oxidoreductase